MDPLKVLELVPGDSLEEAKRHFRAFSLKYHPDKTSDIKAHAKYRLIQEAYEAVKKDPSILNKIPQAHKSYTGYIRVNLKISMEDLYFCKEKCIIINRGSFCKTCAGTGSKNGLSGVCEVCEGTGNIKSSILNLLETSPICPACSGTGIKDSLVCSSCSGLKYEEERVTLKFRVNLRSYYKKSEILKGEGHQVGPGQRTDVIVKLEIEPHPYIDIEENYFVAHTRIHPIQRIIGDTEYVDIFGRTLKYEINQYDVDDYIEDKIGKTFTRKIRVKYQDGDPDISEETLKLYKKILSIEKETIQ